MVFSPSSLSPLLLREAQGLHHGSQASSQEWSVIFSRGRRLGIVETK